jgi:hypothetical protein
VVNLTSSQGLMWMQAPATASATHHSPNASLLHHVRFSAQQSPMAWVSIWGVVHFNEDESAKSSRQCGTMDRDKSAEKLYLICSTHLNLEERLQLDCKRIRTSDLCV